MPKGKDRSSAASHAHQEVIAQGAKDDAGISSPGARRCGSPPSYVLPPVITTVAYSPTAACWRCRLPRSAAAQADGSGLVARLVGLSERIQSLAFSPDGKSLAVTGGSPGRFGEVQIWMYEEEAQDRHSGDVRHVYGASWSPTAPRLPSLCG